MVPDVATGDPTKMLCLHCARRIVSPKFISKYSGLSGYLKFRGSFTNVVQLPFAKIDGIIGDNLPMSAYRSEKWWENSPSSPHAKAWLDAGWETEEVNLKKAYVVFKKVKLVEARRGKRRTSRGEIKKPFTPVPVRLPKPKQPSKTKVSKLYARIRNLERQRISAPSYPGSFKPKPKHEKRLFKPEEKP
jgi:hypothetical protein